MYPVLFTLGWAGVPSFTALTALALGVGLALTWRQARRVGLPQTGVLDVALVAVLVGLLAARVGYVAENWDYFRDRTDEIMQLWRGGLSWHGGWIGGVIGVATASVRRRLNMRTVFDMLTPGLMAGAALGWIGCYLAGVAYGREVFPGDRWWFLAADLPDIYGLWNPRFATQLLGAAWAAVCFIAAVASSRDERRGTKDERRTTNVEYRMSKDAGARFAAVMALYSAGMFMLGFARGDAVPTMGAWRVDQVMDAGIAVAGIAYSLLVFVYHTNREIFDKTL